MIHTFQHVRSMITSGAFMTKSYQNYNGPNKFEPEITKINLNL